MNEFPNTFTLLLYTDVGVRLQVGLGGAPPQREVLVAVFLLGLHRRGVALARGPGREPEDHITGHLGFLIGSVWGGATFMYRFRVTCFVCRT